MRYHLSGIPDANDKAIELLEGMLHDYYHRIAMMTESIPAIEKKRLSETLLRLNDKVEHLKGS